MAFANSVSGPAFAILNELLGTYRSGDGIARPSRYETVILPPSGNSGVKGLVSNIFAGIMGENVGDGTARETSLKCENISFPGRNLDTTPDTNIYGPAREIVQGYSYAEVTGVFQCSSDLREKRLFETWQRLAYNPQTWSMGYYNDYVGSIQIYQLDENDNRRYGVELVEAFPKTIAAQTLDYNAVNQQQKVSVSFSYRYWKSLTDEADLPKSLQDRIANILVNTVERKIMSKIPAVLGLK
tara:strand:- start:2065 stop:2787 length:723 start_codon:yes stop_codon:yes gene_type:complete